LAVTVFLEKMGAVNGARNKKIRRFTGSTHPQNSPPPPRQKKKQIKKGMSSYECFSGPFLLAEQRPVAFSTYTTVD